jgi:hypothetical protein
VKRVECSPRVTHAHVRGEDSDRVLVLKVHGLRDLEPRRDEQVEHWLKLLFGDDYQHGCEWLAHSLDATWGISALVLIGASGTGKGMLVQGLAENFENDHYNDGRVLGRFNVGLLENPIVVLDEGIPSHVSEGRRVDEVMRALTAGGNLAIEPKGMDVLHAQIYPRLVITSNDWDVVQQIVGMRDLSEESLAALETRFLIVSVSDTARTWLTANGNYAFTRGWVAGSVPSSYRVARHVRWLYSTRRRRTLGSGRLLVEGGRHSEMLRSLSMRTPTSQMVLRTVIQMTEDGVGLPGFLVDAEHRIWVVPHGVVNYYEKRLQQHFRLDLTPKKVATVLRKVCRAVPTAATVIPGSSEKQRWWEVNAEVLLREALYTGQPRGRLREVFHRRYGGEALAMLEASFDGAEVVADA